MIDIRICIPTVTDDGPDSVSNNNSDRVSELSRTFVYWKARVRCGRCGTLYVDSHCPVECDERVVRGVMEQ